VLSAFASASESGLHQQPISSSHRGVTRLQRSAWRNQLTYPRAISVTPQSWNSNIYSCCSDSGVSLILPWLDHIRVRCRRQICCSCHLERAFTHSLAYENYNCGRFHHLEYQHLMASASVIQARVVGDTPVRSVLFGLVVPQSVFQRGSLADRCGLSA
jgi:hypothetical protein